MRFRRLAGRLAPVALVLLPLLAAGVFLAVKLPAALAPIAAGERLLSFCAALFLLCRAPSESRPYRLMLLLLPWLGAVLCFFLRGEEQAPPASCAPFEDGTLNALSSLACGGGLHAGYASSAEYLSSGKEMLSRLIPDLSAAQREILLDFYIVARGRFFDTVLQILEEKAKSGVQVKLIFDDFGSAHLPRKFARTLRAKGIKAEVFRPLSPRALFRIDRRDHRKLVLIDGRIAYTGGINLSDEYLGEKIRFGHWKDCAVRLTGTVCAQFSALYGGKTQNGAKTGVPCVPFADGTDGRRTGEELLFRLILAATCSLELCTPYLVPTERMLYALRCASRAGVRVRLMIPHIPDKRAVFLLTRHYARELERAGAEVREYTPGFLHAKCVLADGKYAAVGSYNLDRRSLLTQAECGVLVSGGEAAERLARDFEEIWAEGSPVQREKRGEKLLRILLMPFAPWI